MMFSKYQERFLLRIMSDNEKKNHENKFFYAIKYGKPTNILLKIFRPKLWDVTQLNPSMVIIFAIYITLVF